MNKAYRGSAMRIRPFYYGLLMNTKNSNSSIKGSWEKELNIEI